MVEVFENDQSYDQLFDVPKNGNIENSARLRSDARKIVLCYKAGLYAGRLVREVEAMGRNRYEFVRRGRNMVWALVVQGMLNDKEINDRAEKWGRSLRLDVEFRNWLLELARARCRFILSDLVDDKSYREKVAAGMFDFLRNAAAFKKAMEFAHGRYKWTQRKLI